MNIDITTILINAVVTILTTVIVIRLSLNQGRLGITDKFKESAKKILIKYGQRLLFVLLISNSSYELYKFITDTGPLTRFAIVMVSVNVVLFMMWFSMIVLEVIIFIRKKRNS